jgi:DNA polymerase-3 subunit epsilon
MGIFKRRNKESKRELSIDEGWSDALSNGFVVFDIETTGLSPAGDRIIELGLIRTDHQGTPVGYWSTLINPKMPVRATEIHGIRDKDVATAPTFDECADELIKKLQGQVLVAHNASFDHSFIQMELARAGWELPTVPVVCTMLESKHFLPGLSRKRLVDCAEALGIDQPVMHRALGDATLAASVFHFYLNGPVNANRSEQLRNLVNEGKKTSWPLEKTFPTVGQGVSNRTYVKASPKQQTYSSLLKEVSEVMPEDLLSDQATNAEISYAQVLLESLSDGLISESELESLQECAESIGLGRDSVLSIHRELLLSLSREAWKDGVVSRAETNDILQVAKQLGLKDSDAKSSLAEIEEMRVERLAARVKSLPEDWDLGTPLRIGDRVAITGCYELGRSEMESKARGRGIRITGSVSGKTTMLVSDGQVNGNKERDALQLGIRIVDPSQFKRLLDFVQPPIEGPVKKSSSANDEDASRASVTEHLICTKCAMSFERIVSKGRKPHLCPTCR